MFPCICLLSSCSALLLYFRDAIFLVILFLCLFSGCWWGAVLDYNTLSGRLTSHHCIWLALTPCSLSCHYQDSRKHRAHTHNRLAGVHVQIHMSQAHLQTYLNSMAACKRAQAYMNTHTYIWAAADAVAAGHQVKPARRWQLPVPNEALVNHNTKQWIREQQSSPPAWLSAGCQGGEMREEGITIIPRLPKPLCPTFQGHITPHHLPFNIALGVQFVLTFHESDVKLKHCIIKLLVSPRLQQLCTELYSCKGKFKMFIFFILQLKESRNSLSWICSFPGLQNTSPDLSCTFMKWSHKG